jgi:hypothetical protein
MAAEEYRTPAATELSGTKRHELKKMVAQLRQLPGRLSTAELEFPRFAREHLYRRPDRELDVGSKRALVAIWNRVAHARAA